MIAGLPTDFGYFELLTKGIYLEKINSRYSKDLYIFHVDNDGIFLKQQKISKFKWMKRNNSEEQRILISNIKEIRKGASTDKLCEVYKGHKRQAMEALCCALVLHEGKPISLRANREDVRDAFLECLNYLKNRQSSYNRHQMRNLWYKEQFLKADEDNDSFLSIKEIVKLLNQLNIDVDEFYIVFLLQKESLNMTEFIDLIRKLQSRKSVEDLFKKYSNSKEYLSTEDLHKLLSQEQDESLSIPECEEIVCTYECCPEYRMKRCLSLDGFYYLMNSIHFDIFDSKCSQVYQDMNQPLNHYFVNSSHNTYLEGDQINSYSRIECYVDVLLAGCRCVEIDVWDGGEDPVVTHGYAGTTKLLFSDVISVIGEYAFVKSKYPVILSIENHCSVEQQKKMAKIMRDTFGDKIFTELIAEDMCPTPQQLIEKIIVKCKKMSHPKSASSVEGPEDMMEDEFDSISAGSKPKTVKIAKELSDLIVLCQATKFSGFQHSAANHNFKNICSFDESKARDLAQHNFKEFVSHNMRLQSRIYPSGARIKSSNYDPTLFWLAGCQLVALNYQTPTQPMLLNRGLFSDNGNCGYVLKPDYQRKMEKLEEFTCGPQLLEGKKHFFITIMDGFSLPKKPNDSNTSILDPYIQIKIIGIPEDCYTFKTATIKNNGFNPVWNYQFTFSLLRPEVTLVLFEVHDYENIGSDVLVAQRCFRAETMKTGYRLIHLNSTAGNILLSNLLVHISIK